MTSDEKTVDEVAASTDMSVPDWRWGCRPAESP